MERTTADTHPEQNPAATETPADPEAFARRFERCTHPAILIGRRGEQADYAMLHLEAVQLRHPGTDQPVRFELRENRRTGRVSAYVIDGRGGDWPIDPTGHWVSHLDSARPVHDDLTGLRVEKLQARLCWSGPRLAI